MFKSLGAACALLTLLAACDFPHASDFSSGAGGRAPAYFYGAAVALATPPVNTIVFGPCREEFGMPDGRRANCELHYRMVGLVTGGDKRAPWEQRQQFYAATAYQPGELTCWRTLGKIAECAVVSGPPHKPPFIAAPNTLGAE